MKTALSRIRGVEHDIIQLPQAGDVAPYYEPQGNEIAIFEAAYRKRLPVMLKGGMISDVVAVIGSVDPVMGEADK